MDLQLPQNNNIPDHDHHLSVRVFKWDAEISIGIPEDDDWIRANGVILFRASIIGATATEVVVVPYTVKDMKGRGLMQVLHDIMKRLHMLDSLDEDLPWITYDLLLRELILKFGLGKVFMKTYSNVLVMFFDLKINPDSRMRPCGSKTLENKIKQDCSKRTPHMFNHRVDGEVNLEKMDEIKECLKACPGMVVEKSGGMEELKGCAEISVLAASEEDDADCCICLEELRVGYRYLKTCCGHKFDKVCMMNWLHKRNRDNAGIVSCPVCRNPLYLTRTK